MSNIYEITGDIMTLWNLMDEETAIDEETIIKAMQDSQEELSHKLEGYCKFIKNLETEVEGFKKEEARLKTRRQARENTIKNAKKAMQMAVEASGERKIPCGIFTVSLQKNPASVILDNPYVDLFPPEFIKKVEPELDKTKLKEAIEAGDPRLEGFAHIEQADGLRIR